MKKSRSQIIDILEKQGYNVIDSGYGSYEQTKLNYEIKGYKVKAFYVRTDTRGFKMWIMYGKKVSI